jgi:hypothetical protein
VLDHRKHWDVSAKAMLYRSRELGAPNEPSFRRAIATYNQHGIHSTDGSELGAPRHLLS